MKQILKQIAKENHVTPEEVRFEIQAAIQIGMNSSDPDVRQRWAEIPKKGDVPTPEEVIVFLFTQVSNSSSTQKNAQTECFC